MNIQLANVISDINGLSGQEIIAAILKGERDLWKLADLKHYRVRASREEVACSLECNRDRSADTELICLPTTAWVRDTSPWRRGTPRWRCGRPWLW
jgi:hypothetical protein